MYSPPNLKLWRPRISVTLSSSCQTLLSKLWVIMLFPILFNVPFPGLVGVPPPKSRPRSPTRPAGFELAIPIVCPKFPTDLSQVVPVFRVMWLHPKRTSLTRLLEIDRVQSPTVFQIGAVVVPFPWSNCELVNGSVWYARVKRPEMRSLFVAR